jgi:hypothetical protein
MELFDSLEKLGFCVSIGGQESQQDDQARAASISSKIGKNGEDSAENPKIEAGPLRT